MVIRMRHTRSHTKNRRSHHALKEPTLSVCSNCNGHHRPHHMCLSCGYYNGRQVMDLEAQKIKRNARIQAKRERIRADAQTPDPETDEVKEPISSKDDSKNAREENIKSKRPEKKPE